MEAANSSTAAFVDVTNTAVSWHSYSAALLVNDGAHLLNRNFTIPTILQRQDKIEYFGQYTIYLCTKIVIHNDFGLGQELGGFDLHQDVSLMHLEWEASEGRT